MRSLLRAWQALYTKLQEHIATLDNHSKMLNDFLQAYARAAGALARMHA